jgi:hypothetical protein
VVCYGGTHITWPWGLGSERKTPAVHGAAWGCVGVGMGMGLSPIDARASGLKRPSKALFFLQGVVRMQKKPLSVVRGIKKAVVFPSIFFCGLAKKTNKKKLPQRCTHSPPEYPRRPAPRNAMQCRKGPNAPVRTGHTATFASLDFLRKAGAKTQDLGPGPKAEQRLSRCMALTQKQQISD